MTADPPAASPTEVPLPPVAERRPHRLSAHGDERVDDWFWMRERDDPAVIAHLEAENAYTAAVLARTEALQERLYTEMVGRIEESDESAPSPYGPWQYSLRTVEGLQYGIHCRRPRGGGDEQVVLDENDLAAGHPFLEVANIRVSPDHATLAYATDTTGGERYTLRFRDLGTGRDLPDEVPDTYYGLAWADDGRTVLYLRPDAALRPFQVWRHLLGTPAADDVLVHQEGDERFFVYLGRTRSGRFLVIHAESATTSESYVVPAAAPGTPPRLVAAREAGVEYRLDHQGDRFLILSNRSGPDFALFAAPDDAGGADTWTPIVALVPGTRLEQVAAFSTHVVVAERGDATTRLRVLGAGDATVRLVEAPDAVGAVWIGPNLEYDTPTLRYGWSSLATPATDVDHDLATGEETVVKTQPVRGGYDPEQYRTARLWAPAPDGTRVPVSVLHRHDLALDGSAPALLYGYGAYESSVDPTFRSTRLALVDRGFVYAIAHIRGGGEMGRTWYDDGHLLHKPNSFSDFVAAAEHLTAEGYTSAGRIAARGGSAGGLLVGASVNLAPALFGAVVAEVPFVDVLTTMADPTIPLTVIEWEEWGNPAAAEEYAVMRSYSPYDNLRAEEYPPILATTGLNDARVQFWEPAKWVQRLRAETTGRGPVLLHSDLTSGHGGPSGRYDALRQEALVLAFVLDALGVTGERDGDGA